MPQGMLFLRLFRRLGIRIHPSPNTPNTFRNTNPNKENTVVTGINKYSEIGNVSAVKMESVIQ